MVINLLNDDFLRRNKEILVEKVSDDNLIAQLSMYKASRRFTKRSVKSETVPKSASLVVVKLIDQITRIYR